MARIRSQIVNAQNRPARRYASALLGILLIIIVISGQLGALPYPEYVNLLAWIVGTLLLGFGLSTLIPGLSVIFKGFGFVAGVTLFVGIILIQFGEELPDIVAKPDLHDMLEDVPSFADVDVQELWDATSLWVSELIEGNPVTKKSADSATAPMKQSTIEQKLVEQPITRPDDGNVEPEPQTFTVRVSEPVRDQANTKAATAQ